MKWQEIGGLVAADSGQQVAIKNRHLQEGTRHKAKGAG